MYLVPYMYPSTHVFNQYYFELLKKIRDKARSRKYDSREARHILKGMKAHYQSYDKTDDKYRAWFSETWTVSPEHLYQDVSIADVRALMDKSLIDHFISILEIFMNSELSKAETDKAVQLLRVLNKKNEFDQILETVENQDLKDRLTYVFVKHSESKASEMDDTLKRIEGTSLGKLAKDIMSEINVQELEKTMTDGDLLASLSNPDSGLTKVLSTVSAKMLAKMASGELKQETLLQDAMKLAGELGGGLGGAGLGDMGDMLKKMQNMGLGPKGGGGHRGGGHRGGGGSRGSRGSNKKPK